MAEGEGRGSLRDALEAVDAHLGEVGGRVETASAEMAAARLEMQYQREQRKLLTRVMAVLTVGILVLIALSVLNRAVVVNQRSLTRRFIECTTPGDPAAGRQSERVHPCYDLAEQRQREAIQQVIAGVVTALRTPPTSTP